MDIPNFKVGDIVVATKVANKCCLNGSHILTRLRNKTAIVLSIAEKEKNLLVDFEIDNSEEFLDATELCMTAARHATEKEKKVYLFTRRIKRGK